MELGTKEFNDSAMEMFGGKPKQQTAVEWVLDCLIEQHPNGSFVWNTRADLEALFKQAKEMEKQQQDKFAIGFAEWLLIIYNEDIIYDAYTKEELLETYKKENEL